MNRRVLMALLGLLCIVASSWAGDIVIRLRNGQYMTFPSEDVASISFEGTTGPQGGVAKTEVRTYKFTTPLDTAKWSTDWIWEQATRNKGTATLSGDYNGTVRLDVNGNPGAIDFWTRLQDDLVFGDEIVLKFSTKQAMDPQSTLDLVLGPTSGTNFTAQVSINTGKTGTFTATLPVWSSAFKKGTPFGVNFNSRQGQSRVYLESFTILRARQDTPYYPPTTTTTLPPPPPPPSGLLRKWDGWKWSDNSIFVDPQTTWLRFGSDGRNESQVARDISARLPLLVEVRARVVSGGRGYVFPWVDIYTDVPGNREAQRVRISGQNDQWMLLRGNVNWPDQFQGNRFFQPPRGEGEWATIRAEIYSNRGVLSVKYDDESYFSVVSEQSWAQIDAAATSISVIQPYDARCDVDYVTVSTLGSSVPVYGR